MSSTFTPSDVVDMSKERDWAAAIGMMDWDKTSIVFTKRSLVEFLKYTGTTVDTNYTNINKLPRYAKFGILSEPSGSTTTTTTDASTSATSTKPPSDPLPPSSSTLSSTPFDHLNTNSGFKPTRRVRDVPGGKQTDIFGTDDDDGVVPPPRSSGRASQNDKNRGMNESSSPWDQDQDLRGNAPTQVSQEPPAASQQQQQEEDANEDGFKPTRRVRDAPGGQSSLSNFWDAEETPAFKPTRRVREGPGGKDSISDIF
ncbi:hypothetical protein CPC08DRAFT_711263 [Agrocybe pediades]|nr:hypothetical protein CPC08DRAFT_711263 [Agrocybe pediades]